MSFLSALAVVFLIVCATTHGESFPSRFYGYVNVNPKYNSQMFYAIRSSVPPVIRRRAPLVFFLQGGPGATSLFSDFLETGPERLFVANNTQGYALTKRLHAWTNHVTMVYIDNPIGTGFSYTNSTSGFATSDDEIAETLVRFTGLFMQQHPEFSKNPMWIFCESYGGKMTAFFGAALGKAIQAKEIVNVNFKGVALGDGWVDPVGCMYSYGEYLKGLSQLNDDQKKNITAFADLAAAALLSGNGSAATNYWGAQQDYIMLYTANINFYNSLYYYDYTADNQLNVFLATNFTQQLGSIVPKYIQYNAQSNQVFSMMNESFMNDGISKVDELLAMGYEVNVYSGQLDLIVDTLCTEKWIKKLKWPHLSKFQSQLRLPIYVNDDIFGNVAAFTQQYKNLRFWQIMKAGHMVPLDQPWTAEMMLVQIVGGNKSSIPCQELNAPENQARIHIRQKRFVP